MRRGGGVTAVVTTIQAPTDSLRAFAEVLERHDAALFVVGDLASPPDFDLEGARFLALHEQRELSWELAKLLPEACYARKNLGYLEAIARGSSCIYETDDDNAPLATWAPREIEAVASRLLDTGWVNAYRPFTTELVWPRGFPLELIRSALGGDLEAARPVRAPVQQGLANGSPDVDAVFRLVFDSKIVFDDGPSVSLHAGSWCPFNSQSTWWWSPAFELMYLPSYCSFRMTDIWRSFVAQRCLWEIDAPVVFHGAEVVQERNEHNLLSDLEAEIPGYLRNAEIAERLTALELEPGNQAVASNLVRCYEALAEARIVPPEELHLVHAWLRDCGRAA